MIGSELSNFYALCLTIVVALALALDLRKDPFRFFTARSVVLVGYFSWFLFEALLASDYLEQNYTQSEYDSGIILLAVSILCFLAGYHILPPSRRIDGVAYRLAILEQPRYLWLLTVVAGAIGLAPVIYYGGWNLVATIRGFLGLRATWGGGIGRAQFGGIRDAMLMLELFLLGLAGLAAVYALRSDQPKWKRAVALLVVTYAVFRAYGSGTRSAVIVTAVPIAMAIAWQFPVRIRRRLILLAFPIAVLFFEYSVAAVAGRDQGVLTWGAEVRYVGFEMFRELLFITKYFPDSYDFLGGESYYAELVNPIPRFLWEGKPARFGIEYAAMVAPGVEKYTASYGIVGEMFMNFGTLGVVVLSAFGGWVCRTWDRLFELAFEHITVMTFFAMGLGGFFVLGRSFTFPVFYQTICVLLAALLVTRKEYQLRMAQWRDAVGAASTDR